MREVFVYPLVRNWRTALLTGDSAPPATARSQPDGRRSLIIDGGGDGVITAEQRLNEMTEERIKQRYQELSPTEIVGKYQSLKKRRGGKKARIAIARRILTAIYHMFSKNEAYNAALYQKSEKVPEQRMVTTEQVIAILRSQGIIVKEEHILPPQDAEALVMV